MASIGVITAISLQDKGLHVVLNGGDYAFTVCRYGMANDNDIRLLQELFGIQLRYSLPHVQACTINAIHEHRNEYIGMCIHYGDKPEDIHKI